ncbi:MAG: D-alanine--D-alanine ligase [Candidatus Muirbacterium halophilum]|nr:D-alanine--D-alanine ligase [Candidatus Muirbacterium halophilum]MCK9477634.1 D-alanine--D-alanine ligase [Candidatus Muirbacterium halophilum]
MVDIKKIGLISGGLSKERDISIKSAKNIRRILNNLGFKVIELDIDNILIPTLKNENLKFVYNILHGKYGEDGFIQGFFETLGIKYTGSKVLGSSICNNKVFTKKILMSSNVNTPEFALIRNKEDIFHNTLDFPVVCKPVDEGSSIGVEIITDTQGLIEYIDKNLCIYNEILVEKYIEGMEITVSIIGNEHLTVLPVLELCPKKQFYDFEAKYTPGMTDFILPARISDSLLKKVEDTALEAHRSCYCFGVSRIDMIIGNKDNIPYVLEINTSPGMTDQSDLPAQAKYAGFSEEKLIEEILKSM